MNRKNSQGLPLLPLNCYNLIVSSKQIKSRYKKALKENKLITSEDYAKRKGVTPWWVWKLCRTGRLNATKIAGSWIINEGK